MSVQQGVGLQWVRGWGLKLGEGALSRGLEGGGKRWWVSPSSAVALHWGQGSRSSDSQRDPFTRHHCTFQCCLHLLGLSPFRTNCHGQGVLVALHRPGWPRLGVFSAVFLVDLSLLGSVRLALKATIRLPIVSPTGALLRAGILGSQWSQWMLARAGQKPVIGR